MEAGLFERPLEERDFLPGSKTEVFSLDSGISRGERYIIQAAGIDQALPFRELLPKKYDQLCTEFDRFAHCGSQVLTLGCERCNAGHFVRIRCRSRICEDCSVAWSANIKKQLLPELRKLTEHKRRGFVLAHTVLTVGKWWDGDRMPNSEEIKQFAAWCSSYTRLHYGKFVGAWSRSDKVVERRKKFQGGAWVRVLEFGLDNNNLHAHLIVYGPIKPKTVLDASWSRITGYRGKWVWVERLRNPKTAVGYVMKYLVKPPVSESYGNLAGYAISIKGTRRLATGGVLYNRVRSRLPDPDRPRCSCCICGGRLLPSDVVPAHATGHRIDTWRELWKLKKSAGSISLVN